MCYVTWFRPQKKMENSPGSSPYEFRDKYMIKPRIYSRDVQKSVITIMKLALSVSLDPLFSRSTRINVITVSSTRTPRLKKLSDLPWPLPPAARVRFQTQDHLTQTPNSQSSQGTASDTMWTRRREIKFEKWWSQ